MLPSSWFVLGGHVVEGGCYYVWCWCSDRGGAYQFRLRQDPEAHKPGKCVLFGSSFPGPRCKHTKSVLRPGILDFHYAVNTHCLQCVARTKWVGTWTDAEKEMEAVVSREKSDGIGPLITETTVRAESLERIAARQGGIEKKKSMKKKISKKARKMIRWEAEEVFGDDSVDDFE